MFDLKGKKALITGSSQGIGREIAKVLADQGAVVYVHGADKTQKLEDAKEYAGAVRSVAADLFLSDCADKLYEQTGDIDILILCASIQIKKSWNSFTEKEFDDHINCNLKSSYFIIQKYADDMMKKGWGRIVTIGSVNQYNNHPELAIYGMTKAAQFKLVQNIAPYLAPSGVTVNNIAPGAIETPRNSAVLSDDNFRKKIEASIPMGYVGAPTDINGAVLLLCSDEGRYITGSDIVVDGGMSL